MRLFFRPRNDKNLAEPNGPHLVSLVSSENEKSEDSYGILGHVARHSRVPRHGIREVHAPERLAAHSEPSFQLSVRSLLQHVIIALTTSDSPFRSCKYRYDNVGAGLNQRTVLTLAHPSPRTTSAQRARTQGDTYECHRREPVFPSGQRHGKSRVDFPSHPAQRGTRVYKDEAASAS